MAQQSDVSISNRALSHVGVTAFIDDLDGRSKEARVLNLHYDATRDSLLEVFPWAFADRHITMTLRNETPPSIWLYSYTYPIDAVRILGIPYPGARTIRSDQRIPYKLANNGSERVIYSNLALAGLMYTQRVTNPTLFSPLFTTALEFLLASKLVMPLALIPNLIDKAVNSYNIALSAARTSDITQSVSYPEADSQLLTIRDTDTTYFDDPRFRTF